jgi:hypothetical protein
MIRTIVTPLNSDLHIQIPANYIGKEIEVLLYSTEEINDSKNKNVSKVSLRGSLNLSKEQYSDITNHANDSRNEWNRNI